nr:PilX N-terminal domain-containing pilus assembly protein [Thiocystis violacea]
MIVALIFLVALTLLGTSGTMNNTMQERMASNTRNRDLAFQAAEHAIETAETWINSQTIASLQTAATTTANDGVRDNGEQHANDLDYWSSTFNWGSTDLRVPSTLAGVATQPSYLVERMPSGSCPGNATATCEFYRVTARGIGAETQAVVILQTMYAIN